MKTFTTHATIQQSFKIKFKYKIHFTKNLFNLNNKLIYNILKHNKISQKKTLIFIDKKVIKHHLNLKKNILNYFHTHKTSLILSHDPIMISGGEHIKNHYSIVKCIYKIIDQYKICRQSYIIAIGGGTILDLIGYIAATAHRGINFIRVPTTILSQDDSGVGVKNGINFINKKNFIGVFSPPYAVINDYTFLTSLNNNIWTEGISEAIKVSLIKNSKFFTFIRKNTHNLISRNMLVMRKTIYQCAKLHAHHISKNGDPFETSSSRPLDFGHWAAHKLEIMTKHKLSHGESVAIGIALDCTYSYLIKLLSKKEWKIILHTLINLNFKIYTKELSIKKSNTNIIFNGLSDFREHLGGTLTITLIKKIGSGINLHHVSTKIYKKAIFLLKKYTYLINNIKF